MIITVVPTRVLKGSASRPINIVLLNNNAGGGANLEFGNQPHSLGSEGKVIVPGGVTPQLSIVEDLWVRGVAGNVDLRVDIQ